MVLVLPRRLPPVQKRGEGTTNHLAAFAIYKKKTDDYVHDCKHRMAINNAIYKKKIAGSG